MANNFMIEYKPKELGLKNEREYFENEREFSKKYFQLKKEGLIKTVNRFCRISGSLITGLSDYGIRNVLIVGTQPDKGYIIANEKEGKYYNVDSIIFDKKYALKFETEDLANEKLKKLKCGVNNVFKSFEVISSV